MAVGSKFEVEIRVDISRLVEELRATADALCAAADQIEATTGMVEGASSLRRAIVPNGETW